MSKHGTRTPDTGDGQQETISGAVVDQQDEDKPATEEALREAEPESATPASPATKDLPIDDDTTSPRYAKQPKHFSGQAEAGPADAADPQEESAPKTKTVFCVACGAEMDRSDKFCHACGWDRRVPPTPPPQRPVDPNPSPYNRLAALLLCLILGFLGLHRFYVGKVGTGLLWLFTLGFLSVGVIFDLVLISTGEFRDAEQRRVLRWADPQVG
ncbi:MAG: TM2 domain-containing protein [Bryobacterales bacterium]|nr:TM2 domain-containing protein [Bryobacterales bacterium]MDE0296009.1 TM2 domain-containing protein [Bryobacterales bacterium]